MNTAEQSSRDERTVGGLPRLYTSRQVASALGISRERVTQLVREGTLGAVRFGPRGRYRFHPGAIDELLERAHHAGEAAEPNVEA